MRAAIPTGMRNKDNRKMPAIVAAMDLAKFMSADFIGIQSSSRDEQVELRSLSKGEPRMSPVSLLLTGNPPPRTGTASLSPGLAMT